MNLDRKTIMNHNKIEEQTSKTWKKTMKTEKNIRISSAIIGGSMAHYELIIRWMRLTLEGYYNDAILDFLSLTWSII